MLIKKITPSLTLVFLLAACGGGGGGGGSPSLASSNQAFSNRYNVTANVIETFAEGQGFAKVTIDDNQQNEGGIAYYLTPEANDLVDEFNSPDFDFDDYENDDFDDLASVGTTPAGQTISQGSVNSSGLVANVTVYSTTNDQASLAYLVFPDINQSMLLSGGDELINLPSGTFEYSGTFTAGDWNYQGAFSGCDYSMCTDSAHDVGNFRMDVDFDNAVITDFIAGVPLGTPINRLNPDEIYNSTTLEWATLLSASNISINTTDGSFATTQGDLRTLPENTNFVSQFAPYYKQSDAKIYGAFSGINAESVSGVWYEFPNETGRNSYDVSTTTNTPSMAGGFVGSR